MNKDHEVNYSEFLMAAFDFQKNLNLNSIKSIFEMIDEDKSNEIDVRELKNFLNLNEESALLKQIIKEVDQNGDGRI